MKVNRLIQTTIDESIDFQKAIIIKGARQVGKTTLIQSILQGKEKVLWVDGDDPQVRSLWSNITKSRINLLLKDYQYIVIDEAQRIENIGLAVKMIVDQKLDKQVIVSGSSSINLSSSINEPLTGRKWSFDLFPISWEEYQTNVGLMDAISNIESLLIYGSYPEVLTATNNKESRLQELASSYLYKDILNLLDIRKPEVLHDLLRALAYQVGSEVSYNEIGRMLKIDNETVQRYIDILEDSYILFRLEPLSTNPRKEISTSRKIYFYDNGIRNAIINNFNLMNNRNDIGQLWENYIISELLKKEKYRDKTTKLYFWRAKSGSEIDLVLNSKNQYKAYELKYNPKRIARFSSIFKETYEPISMQVINIDNFYEFL